MIIKYGKRYVNVDVEAGETVGTLKRKLLFSSDCKFLKLVLNGKALSNDEELISNLPGGALAKIVMVGTEKQVDVEAPTQLERIRDDLTADGRNSSISGRGGVNNLKRTAGGTVTVKERLTYGFGDIETLPGYGDREKARGILESLANDPGILATMKKRKFFVPVLRELPPDGYVGVSDVCLMGLNENFGQRISLRIRTDDLLGFRKILSIKKVLCHELAHNIHGPHDDKFYVLMRQIEKDVDDLDWTKSSGHKAGGIGANTVYRHNNNNNNSGTSSEQQQPLFYKLGGESVFGNVDAVSAAGAAAVMRYSAEEKEIEYSCGSSSSSSSSTGIGDVDIIINGDTEKSPQMHHINTTVDNKGDDGPMLLVEKSSNIRSNVDAVEAETIGAIESSFEDASTDSVFITATASCNIPTSSNYNVVSTETAPLSAQNSGGAYSIEEFLSRITVFIDETIANAYSLDTSQSVIDKLCKLQEEIQQLVVGNDWEKEEQEQTNEQRKSSDSNSSNSNSKLLGCFKLLHKIVLNAKVSYIIQ